MTTIRRRSAAKLGRLARALRWPAAAWLLITWWSTYPPTTVGELAGGLGVLILALRLTARRQVRERRRATLRARCCMAAVIGILGGLLLTPMAASADVDPDVGYCRAAPSAETSGDGVTGMLDPQADLPKDGTPYGDTGYAGLFWYAYDPGCVAAAGEVALGQIGGAAAGAFDGNDAGGQTTTGNVLLKIAKLEIAGATGMRARALDPDYFHGFDTIFVTGVNALKDLVITPWMSLPLMLLGLILLTLAHRGRSSESARKVVTAVVGLGLIVFLGQYPLQVTAWLDGKLVAIQKGFDRGFIDKLPTSMTPIIHACDYPDKIPAPKLEDGDVVIPGIACTKPYRPSLNLDDNWTVHNDGVAYRYQPEYFEKDYYPEMLVNHTIFRFWEKGLLGTDDLSGPNYDLAKQFIDGQAQTLQEAGYEAQMQKVGTQPGANLCRIKPTGERECMVMGIGQEPPPLMSGNEEAYRVAVTRSILAGKYPFVQGKAGNRISAGASALAAATAAAPTQFAAYTGVFAGRLLLRFFVVIGLICAMGLLMGSGKLLRRIWMTVGSALVTMAILTVTGSLMTYLTLQAIGNPKLFPGTGGLVILAVLSILIWVIVKPMRRIAAMVSTAATGDPNTLSNMRSKTMSRVLSFGRRRHQGKLLKKIARRRGHDDNDTDPSDEESETGETNPQRRRPESQAAMDQAASTTRLHTVSRPPATPDPAAPTRYPRAGADHSTATNRTPAAAGRVRAENSTSTRERPQTPETAAGNIRVAERTPTGVHVITTAGRPRIYRPHSGPERPSNTMLARNRIEALSARERNRQLVWRPMPRALPPGQSSNNHPSGPRKNRPESGTPIVVEAGS